MSFSYEYVIQCYWFWNWNIITFIVNFEYQHNKIVYCSSCFVDVCVEVQMKKLTFFSRKSTLYFSSPLPKAKLNGFRRYYERLSSDLLVIVYTWIVYKIANNNIHILIHVMLKSSGHPHLFDIPKRGVNDRNLLLVSKQNVMFNW